MITIVELTMIGRMMTKWLSPELLFEVTVEGALRRFKLRRMFEDVDSRRRVAKLMKLLSDEADGHFREADRRQISDLSILDARSFAERYADFLKGFNRAGFAADPVAELARDWIDAELEPITREDWPLEPSCLRFFAQSIASLVLLYRERLDYCAQTGEARRRKTVGRRPSGANGYLLDEAEALGIGLGELAERLAGEGFEPGAGAGPSYGVDLAERWRRALKSAKARDRKSRSKVTKSG